MSDTDKDIACIILPLLFKHDVLFKYFLKLFFCFFSAEKTATKFMLFCHFSIGYNFSVAIF